ncbi:MAG TPA: tryptophan synthase subunit alpha [Fimbriimonas sp.]
MNPLHAHLKGLAARGEKALVLFVTAGDQPLDELPELLRTLEEGGADVIEVGLPFSDPYGEGPTIQASSQRALDSGATTSRILDAMSTADLHIPMVTMGYTNPVLHMGLREFARRSREAGSTGTILSDLVPDEAHEWAKVSAEAGLGTIFLVAPTSTDQRIREVVSLSSGFVYAVSRTGVTGAENEVPPDVDHLVRKVRALTDLPICVGFGISTPEHVRRVCRVADGAVVGSSLVKLLHERWHHGEGRGGVLDMVRSLKSATRE